MNDSKRQDPEWSSTSIGTISFSTFRRPIRKSEQDEREYRLIKLDNGLEAMLVHDAKADKAAASLDVAVGHLWDPVSRHMELSWASVKSFLM